MYTVSYIRSTTSGGGSEEGLTYPIWKIEKDYPDFGKKDPVCVHLWAEFSFKMHFSEYLGEKMIKFLLAGPFVHETFIFVAVPLFQLFQKTSPAPKIRGYYR